MLRIKTTAVVAALIMAVFLLLPVVEAQAQAVIGVVDLGKVITDSKRGKDAQNKVKKKEETLKKSLEPKQNDLKKKRDDLEKTASTLSQDAFEKRRQDLNKEFNTYMEQEQKALEDLQKTQADAMQPVMQKIESAVTDIAKQRGFSMVVDITGGGVIYYDNALDITADVIKAVDK
ncbi:MAG: OmpH family outer membrane protein [Deltaproteobacteria bacterium]|nr:OmpH family outer membrane protein [Deltaproteobacteria bacterium]